MSKYLYNSAELNALNFFPVAVAFNLLNILWRVMQRIHGKAITIMCRMVNDVSR